MSRCGRGMKQVESRLEGHKEESGEVKVDRVCNAEYQRGESCRQSAPEI